MQDNNEVGESIMGCQGILDDLRALSWRLDDIRNSMDPEDISSAIRGLEVLYEIKFRLLWDNFNKTFNT